MGVMREGKHDEFEDFLHELRRARHARPRR